LDGGRSALSKTLNPDQACLPLDCNQGRPPPLGNRADGFAHGDDQRAFLPSGHQTNRARLDAASVPSLDPSQKVAAPSPQTPNPQSSIC